MKLLKDYLIHSYLYYQLDVSIISDQEFDTICKSLLAQWPISHPHAHLVDIESLKASTGYSISSYPSVVKHLAITAYWYHTNGHNPYTSDLLSLSDTLVLHRFKESYD